MSELNKTISIKSLDDIASAAQEFIKAIGDHRVFAFNGSMGAGKTTFISAICQTLGVTQQEIASPTFAIHNEYETQSGEMLHHFDLYRLNDISEVLDAGIEDYIDSGELCFIEWPEVASPLLPDDTVAVEITEQPDGSRLVTLNSDK